MNQSPKNIHSLPQVYRYGANIIFYGVSYVITMVVTSEIFLPVFYRLAITSTYEVGGLIIILIQGCLIQMRELKFRLKHKNLVVTRLYISKLL